MLTFLKEWRGLPPEEVLPYASESHGDTNFPSPRGYLSRLPYHDPSLMPNSAEFTYEPCEGRELFYFWANEQNIWTLGYSDKTLLAGVQLEEDYPEEWEKIKAEIFPAQANKHLHLKHGAPGAYTSGCRGPLCKAAIRNHMRNWREDTNPTSDLELERLLEQIGLSFQHYWTLMYALRRWRTLTDIRKKPDPLRWSSVDLRKTILMDATDI